MVARLQLDRTGASQPREARSAATRPAQAGFAQTLEQALTASKLILSQATGKAATPLIGARSVGETSEVTFSAHAMKRLGERGAALTPAAQTRLDQAVADVAAKGGRESLVLLDDLALLVSVPNRTVITAMPREQMGGMVFTNIDSAVVAPA